MASRLTSNRQARTRRLRLSLLAFCLHIPVGLLLMWTGVGTAIGDEAAREAPMIGVFIAFIIPATISVLLFLEDAGRNRELSDQEKRRWRRLMAAIPYTLVVYWWQFGRRKGQSD